MEEFFIPIDNAINSFFEHLKVNQRTILSSKFGDGKSYFLEKFKETEYVKERYTFLTLYPVNYQVTTNEDIFSLIKRDILFQLLINGMLEDQITIPENVALWFYLQNKGISLVADLFNSLSAVAVKDVNITTVLESMNTLKLFKSLKLDFDKFKQETNRDALIDNFLSSVEEKTIYEEDIVTFIIKETIKSYKEKTGKEVVLIVEDMDRIDPAHLFRILNIFSAHIDYGYKYFNKPDKSIAGNKFELDNIVLVCDYSNIRTIFIHFYGKDTDFDGYIGKFTSSLPFSYSLQDEREEYIYDLLYKTTDCPKDLLHFILDKENDSIRKMTLREIVHAIKLEQKLSYGITLNREGEDIVLCPVMLRVLSVMKRLGISDDRMKDIAENVFMEKTDYFIRYIAPYMLLLHKENINLSVCVYSKSSTNNFKQYITIEKNGEGRRGTMFLASVDEVQTDFPAIIECMLKYVIK